MKYSVDELNNVGNILEQYEIIIKDKKLPKLNSVFNKFYSSFYHLFSTLITEKIISMDPYGEENNLDKLDLPDSSPIAYNEESYAISIRLSHYNSLLNHIKINNILSIENLSVTKIEKLKRIFSFMDWKRIFDPQPEEVNTEGLNKILFYYQKDVGQKMIIATLKAAISDIENYSKECLKELGAIKIYFNESYKLWIREEILPFTKLPPVLQGLNIKSAHDLLCEKIKNQSKPLHIELIGEILNEDFTEEGDNVKKDILQKLTGSNTPKKSSKEKLQIPPIDLLKSSIVELNKITTQIDTIIGKEQDNSKAFREEKYSLFEKFLDYLSYTLIGNKRKTIYKLSIEESVDNKVVIKEVELERLLYNIKNFKKLLNNTNDDISGGEIEITEDELNKSVNSLISTSKYIYKHLFALDVFFKNSLTLHKGIQIELKVFLSTIDKTQSIYFEYKKQKSDGLDETIYKPDISLTT